MSIQELETAVTRLSREELTAFSEWFEEYVADAWDRQIGGGYPCGPLCCGGEACERGLRSGALHTALKHFASPEFWIVYRRLPEAVRDLADKNFHLLKANPRRASVRLKKAGSVWSAGVGLHYRVLSEDHPDGTIWHWIGRHGTYDQIP